MKRSFVATKFCKHDISFRCVNGQRCVEKAPIFATDKLPLPDSIWERNLGQGDRVTPGYRNRSRFSPRIEIAFEK